MSNLVLRATAGCRRDDGTSLAPCWTAPAFLLCAAMLIPWTAFLFLTLPRHYSANHWHVAWGGFDIALAIALTSTAVLTLRRSPLTEIAATVTGTLLVCDAWFDVLTSHGTGNVAQALAEALLLELPLAALCFWIARNFAHAIESAHPFLEAAGFRIRNRKLVASAGAERSPAGMRSE